MKNFALIAKILTAVAALVGIAYIIATYGEQIIAWAKKLLNACPCKCTADDCANCECDLDCPADEEIFADAAEEVEEVMEAPAAVTVDETAPIAEESDFE